ncbi:MAG: hypothetical protein ABI408_10090 [Gemmatimonadaceae bacterium]
MEEAAVAVLQFFARLIWPIGLVAIVFGILSAGVAAFASASKNGRGNVALTQSSILERIVVWFCAVVSLLALVVVIQTIRFSPMSMPTFSTLSVLLAIALLLLALPALLWRTRLRWMAEGFALIGLAGSAILGMWSIGVFFLPPLALMLWVCIQHVGAVASALSTASRSG